MALTRYELDLVIGGITENSPWQREVAFTIPYYTSHALIGVPPTDAPIADLDGVTVTVRKGSELAALVKDQGGIVRAVETLTGANGPVAAEAWEIRGLGLRPTTIELTSDNHVMATPQGENALLMQLEEFLLQQTADADLDRLLWEAAAQ
jgi:ABC-type amino acid transport substrate-binding protein